jgi:predicted DNA-binding WGR domain protein
MEFIVVISWDTIGRKGKKRDRAFDANEESDVVHEEAKESFVAGLEEERRGWR